MLSNDFKVMYLGDSGDFLSILYLRQVRALQAVTYSIIILIIHNMAMHKTPFGIYIKMGSIFTFE